MQKTSQRIILFFSFVFFAANLLAQPGTITTIAGGSTPLNGPYGVSVDSAGNVYIADWASGNILKVSPGGVMTTVWNNINFPEDVAVDSSGNLYIADSRDNRVLKVNPSTGSMVNVAGTGKPGYDGEGSANSVKLNNPAGVVLDSGGNVYIADQSNHRVRKVTPDGTISTVAGTGIAGFSGDGGPAVNAQINNPVHIAVDSAGNLYITDYYNNRIRKVSANGTITTIAGSSSDSRGGFSGDGGPATAAQLTTPAGVAVDAAGNVYIADSGNHRIRRINTSGIIQTIAGGGTNGDGCMATTASLNFPIALALNTSGTVLYVADYGANLVRAIQLGGNVTAPNLSSLSPSSGVVGTTNSVTISGSGFSVGGSSGGCSAGPTVVSISGSGVTASDAAVVSDSAVTVTLTVAAGAPLGTHDLTVTNANGTSNTLQFDVVPPTPAPTLQSISPSTGIRGTTVNVTLTGTHFDTKSGGTSIAVSGSGVAVSNINVSSTTSMTATFTIDANAAPGKYNVTASTSQGSSSTVPFTVNALPTITAISPPNGLRGSNAVVTISGSNFDMAAGATQVSAGTGVNVSTVTVTSPTSLTATLAIDPNATLGNHGVSVTTNAGASNAMQFAINPPGPSFTYGLPDTLNPTQNAPLGLTMTSPSPDPVTGQVTFTFTSNAAVNSDDPNVMFVNAQTSTRTVDFTIPANSTTAALSLPDTVLQAGTVAGSIELTTTQVQVGSQIVTPSSGPFDVTVPRTVPTITGVRILNRTSKGFDVEITGYSDSKDITQATFSFSAKSGEKLDTVQLRPDVTSIFSDYYQSSSEPMAGGSFVYTQPFIAQKGNANVVASVTVTLTNSVGKSQPKSAQ
jgi:sugar lactone lactonase YvrE